MYFNPDCRQHAVGQGTLPDGTFLGTLMAICCYAKYDLIENIFASRPEDFVKYGIYTCRFYVDGEWVEVITDTSIPCIRNYSDGTYLPAYGHSSNTNELWVCFVAKAFAKAMGSYEEIPNIKVQKALLHLTGGSTQQVSLKEEVAKLDAYSEGSAWKEFKDRFENDTLVILMPAEKKTFDGTLDGAGFVDPLAATENTIGQDTKAELFIPGMLYSVVLCKDIGGYELVLMHNPWKDPNYVWTGEWSDTSNDWDLYPEILFEVEKDARVPWRRRRPNGYFWISFRNLVKYFNKMFCCKLFPNDKFNFYCVRGECRGRQAGGPLGAIRDIETVKAEAAKSRISAIQKVCYNDLFNFNEFGLLSFYSRLLLWSSMVMPLGSTTHNIESTVSATQQHWCMFQWSLLA